MPFNAQLEMFDESLLQAAVQLTHDLDGEFKLPHKRTLSLVSTGIKAMWLSSCGSLEMQCIRMLTMFA